MSKQNLKAQSGWFPGVCYHNNDSLRLDKTGVINTCANSVDLTVLGNPGSTVFWTDGYTGSTRKFTYSTQVQAYTVDSSGCYDTTELVTINVNGYKAALNYSGTSACPGQPVYLSAYSWNSPTWNTGDTGFYLTPTKSGKYFFTTTHPNGCADTSNSVDITVADDPKLSVKWLTDSLRCEGEPIELEASFTGKGFIKWSNGENGNKIKVTTPSYLYAVWYSDSTYACVAYSRPFYASYKMPVSNSLCMATIDSTRPAVKLLWKKDTKEPVVGWYILRETDAAFEFDTLGYVSANASTEFLDTTVNPRQKAFTYAIAALDSCGNTDPSAAYLAHSTLHLTASVGVSGENNLNWSAYQGILVKSYEIYRSNAGGAFQSIAKVAGSKFQYSDLNPPSGTNQYYVAIISDNVSCQPGKVVKLRSNAVVYGSLSAGDAKADRAVLYPNPGQQQFQVSLASGAFIKQITVLDATGKTIYTETGNGNSLQVNASNWSQGIYIVRVTDQTGNIKQQKWIKN